MTDGTNARQTVEAAHAHLEQVKREVPDEYGHHIAAALDRIIELTVVEQYEVTTDMNPLELKHLKLQVTGARQVAIDQVATLMRSIDLEALAKRVQPGTNGDSYIGYDELLSPLLDKTCDLLAHSGYSTDAFSSLKVGGNYSISRIPGLGFAAASATRRLDAAVEEYGKAKTAADELSKQARRDAAREAWGRAI